MRNIPHIAIAIAVLAASAPTLAYLGSNETFDLPEDTDVAREETASPTDAPKHPSVTPEEKAAPQERVFYFQGKERRIGSPAEQPEKPADASESTNDHPFAEPGSNAGQSAEAAHGAAPDTETESVSLPEQMVEPNDNDTQEVSSGEDARRGLTFSTLVTVFAGVMAILGGGTLTILLLRRKPAGRTPPPPPPSPDASQERPHARLDAALGTGDAQHPPATPSP